MKKLWWVVFSLSVLTVGVGSACGTTIINDNYWGGVPSGGPDAGGPSKHDVYGGVPGGVSYDIIQMDISFVGTVMAVKISGPFFRSNGWDGGDLYLSSKGWLATGTGSDHYGSDTFNDKEGWDYVISKFGPKGTGVYALDFDTSNSSTMIHWTSGPEGRRGQAWHGGYGAFQESATVEVRKAWTEGFVSFEFDTVKLNLGPTFGLHFTMDCGNDVIEGGVPGVPEPATLFFLGLGVVGLGMVRLRRKP